MRNIPLATLLLVLLNLLLFYSWSGSMLGTPSASIVMANSFQLSQPLTYFTYSLVHLWPLHLFANLALLLTLGILLEQKLGPQRFFIFYFAGAALAGISATVIDLFFGIEGAIVGASGAIFTLLGGAIATRPFKATLAYLLLSLFIVPTVLAVQLHDEQSNVKEQAVREVEALEEEKQVAEREYAKEELTKEEYVQKAQEISAAMETPSKQIVKIQEAQRREEQVPTAETIHITGLIVGTLLAFSMCPELSEEWAHRPHKVAIALRRMQKRFL